jgi:hypothetical protein
MTYTKESIEQLLAKVPEDPWFVDADVAEECGPHRHSGLALVDTGRESDWPIARLCEWHTAKFIAAAPSIVRELLAENETLRWDKHAGQDLINAARIGRELITENESLRSQLAESQQQVSDNHKEIDRLRIVIRDRKAERERLQAAERQLWEASQEINCAGPIAHRVRILKKEHAEQLAECERRVVDLQSENTELRTQLERALDPTQMCMDQPTQKEGE